MATDRNDEAARPASSSLASLASGTAHEWEPKQRTERHVSILHSHVARKATLLVQN